MIKELHIFQLGRTIGTFTVKITFLSLENSFSRESPSMPSAFITDVGANYLIRCFPSVSTFLKGYEYMHMLFLSM